ncbi:MAG: recombinase family protein [Ruminococcus sp.]|nr:recombinase family protein [Ruminococcus sp.]
MAAQGIGYNKTAKTFREEKVLTPIAYFNLHNPDYYKSDYWRKEFDWHVTSIRVILENEVYLGKLIYGKQKSKSMKSKQKVKCPREEWIVVENCHEPIITQELWDSAHRMLSSKRRPTMTGEVQMFAGLLLSDGGLNHSEKQGFPLPKHNKRQCCPALPFCLSFQFRQLPWRALWISLPKPRRPSARSSERYI